MEDYFHELDFALATHPDYFQILLQSSLIAELTYEPNPVEALSRKTEFKYLNHEIKSMCISQTVDEIKDSVTGLEVKYMICDCSTKTKKRLIIGFRGTKTIDDFLIDLKLHGELNYCQGRFHSGIYRRSETIPITNFVQKLIEDEYELIFTGHSLGAAVAALVTVKILLHRALVESDILALLSNVIHEEKEVQNKTDYIDNCKSFLRTITKPIFSRSFCLRNCKEYI